MFHIYLYQLNVTFVIFNYEPEERVFRDEQHFIRSINISLKIYGINVKFKFISTNTVLSVFSIKVVTYYSLFILQQMP